MSDDNELWSVPNGFIKLLILLISKNEGVEVSFSTEVDLWHLTDLQGEPRRSGRSKKNEGCEPIDSLVRS